MDAAKTRPNSLKGRMVSDESFAAFGAGTGDAEVSMAFGWDAWEDHAKIGGQIKMMNFHFV